MQIELGMIAPNPSSLLKPEPRVPLPLLVTGVAGVAGYNAFHYFRQRYPGQVIGIRQRDNHKLTGDGVVACDAEDRDELAKLFAQHRFKSVLNAAGNCALRACELGDDLAWRINLEGVRNLLDAIESVGGVRAVDGTGSSKTDGVRLVHLSIDLVYGGNGYGGHVETDPTDPVTVYGKTMVAAEELLAERAPSTCIFRISLPMGVSFNGHAGAIDWIQSRFKKQKPATLYFDEIRTPHYTDCLNEVCETALSYDRLVEPLSGLFHAGGPRPLSLFQIAQVINRVGGYDPDLLMGCPRLHAGPIPPRAGNVAMDSSKLARALGYEPFDPWPLDAAHVPTDRLWHYRRRGNETGSPELLSQVLYRNPGRKQ
jgi:dTDP-4-dehydrorhamnose reductase